MIPAGGALVSAMNAIADAPPELGFRHIGMPTTPERVVAGDPGGEERKGGVVGHASTNPGRVNYR
jgi:hypothetical protein